MYFGRDVHPPRAMSSSVHLRSGLVWMRHLNTAPGDCTDVLYLESAFGAPTRTLHGKKKGHLSQPSTRKGRLMVHFSPSHGRAARGSPGNLPQRYTELRGQGRGSNSEPVRFSPDRFKAYICWKHIQPTHSAYPESIRNSYKSIRKIQVTNIVMDQRLQ